MSVITGLWLKDGGKIDPHALTALSEPSGRYAPDGTKSFAKNSLWMMSQALHTHERSFFDTGMTSDATGNVVTLDGRIDNYEDLCRQLGLSPHSTADSALVLAAYRNWGVDSLRHLVGDWSLSLWDDSNKILCLARDHAGTRSLYYTDTPQFTMWSTFPESILAYTGVQELDRQYVQRYLMAAPTGELTPYAGIKSVPAACYLLIRERGETRLIQHWNALVKDKLHYQRDEDYQEEFLGLFCQAVGRRTGGVGAFAHLSGGVDSSSIVCVADLVASREGKAPSMQTVSFFDDQEPDWNEHPYFTAVEQHRGVRGVHIHTSAAARDFAPPPVFYPFPGADSASHEREKHFVELPALSACRVFLAGHGGDELLGGPPDPRPELAGALVSLSFRKFFRSSFDWALSKRVPLVAVAADAVKFTMRCYPRIPTSQTVYPSWLVDHSDRGKASDRFGSRAFTIGFSPSAVGIVTDWLRLLETLPHRNHGHHARYEYRYPYLDRDLVDFLLRVPPNQLVRPGRRRFMMRAALRGIVPDSVLERRRKAFVSRGPLVALQSQTLRLADLLRNSFLEEVGVVDASEARNLLNRPSGEGADRAVPLFRLFEMEIWIGQAHRRGVFAQPKVVAACQQRSA